MRFVDIPTSDTLAGEPLDQTLMATINEDLDDLDARITAGTGGSGGGGGGSVISSIDAKYYDHILEGGKTNEAINWRKRFPFNSLWISPNAKDGDAVDFEGIDQGKSKLTWGDYASTFTSYNITQAYKGSAGTLPKSKYITVQIKKGVNYFSFSTYTYSTESDRIEVLIDGVTPSSLGLYDEKLGVASNFISANQTAPSFRRLWTCIGLDETKEHIIQILNNDSAAKTTYLNYYEIGYVSLDYTITNRIKLSNGITKSGAKFTGGEFSFNQNTYSGHQGALVIDSNGVVSAMDGETNCGTIARPFVAIDFPNYPTSIKTQANYNFPASGICSITNDYGNTYLFSYMSKDESSTINYAFLGVKWQSVFNISETPGLGPLLSQGRMDFPINYIGTAPIVISNSNNKIDFSITINGVTSSHSATLENGCYSSDLVPFNFFFNKAMQSAKSINGLYKAVFDSNENLWFLSVEDPTVSSISFLFSSGVNVANSVAPTLGFSVIDLTGSTGYLGATEKPSLCCRAFEKGEIFDYTSPKVKIHKSGGTAYNNPILSQLESFTGLNIPVVIANGGNPGLVTINVSPEACGMELTFEGGKSSFPIIVCADHRFFYNIDLSASLGSTLSPIMTYFFTFPKGTRILKFYTPYLYSPFGSSGTYVRFQYAREYFCRPPIEKLLTTQKIIKLFEIAPTQFYENIAVMQNSGANIVAQGGIDKITSSVESGSITGITNYNYSTFGVERYSYTQNAYWEYGFTISKDGGGFSFRTFNHYGAPDGTTAIAYIYLTDTGTINESTDLYSTIQQGFYQAAGSVSVGFDRSFVGLKARTYKVRIKKADAYGVERNLIISNFSIIDSPMEPYVAANPDVSLTNRSIPIPVNNIYSSIYPDDELFTTSSEYRTNYNIDLINNPYNMTFWAGYELTNVFNTKIAPGYYSLYNEHYLCTSNTFSFTPGVFSEAICFGTEITMLSALYSGYSQSMVPQIDSIALSAIDSKNNKSGVLFNSVMLSMFPLVCFQLNSVCAFSSGNTFTCSNTRYIRPNSQIILFDSAGNYEQLFVVSVVTNTSFTVDKVRTVVVDANVNSCKSSGLHYVKYSSSTSATNFSPGPIMVSPLPILKSNFLEKFSEKALDQAISQYIGLAAGTQILSFPIFKDGTRGNANNTTVIVTGMASAAVYYTISLGSNITIVITGGTLDLRIVSIRSK